MSKRQLGGIEVNARRQFNVWVLTPIGGKQIVARGLSKADAEETLEGNLKHRRRVILHLKEIRVALHEIDKSNNVELRAFDSIVE